MKIDPDAYQMDYAAMRVFCERTQQYGGGATGMRRALLFAEAQQMLRMAVNNFCLLLRYLGNGEWGTAKHYSDDDGYVAPYLDCGLELAGRLMLLVRPANGEWRDAEDLPPPARAEHLQAPNHFPPLPPLEYPKTPLELWEKFFGREKILQRLLTCSNKQPVNRSCPEHSPADPEREHTRDDWCDACIAREGILPNLVAAAASAEMRARQELVQDLFRQERARTPALQELLECAVGKGCHGPTEMCTPCRAREIELPRLLELAASRAP